MHDLNVTTGATLPLLGWARTERLDPRRILPLRTEECAPAKPAGGLWTSPLYTAGPGTAWTRWCHTERHDRTFTTLTIIRVASTARVVVINSDDDVHALDRRYGHGDPQIPPRTMSWPRQRDWEELTTQRFFDWPAIAAAFDAVQVTDDGLNCGGGVIPRLRWDVPSVWFPRAAFHIDSIVAMPTGTVSRRPAWWLPRGRVRYLDAPPITTPRRPS